MSRILAGVAVAFGVLTASLFSLDASDHAYTITLTKQGSTYKADKDKVFEIDFAKTTVFTIKNTTEDDLDFAIDADPQKKKCRVDFEPAVADCISKRLPVPARGSATLEAHAADLGRFEYSWFFGKPKFKSDVLVAVRDAEFSKADPDLELERDFGAFARLAALIAALVAALAAWRTRRRS